MKSHLHLYYYNLRTLDVAPIYPLNPTEIPYFPKSDFYISKIYKNSILMLEIIELEIEVRLNGDCEMNITCSCVLFLAEI